MHASDFVIRLGLQYDDKQKQFEHLILLKNATELIVSQLLQLKTIISH